MRDLKESRSASRLSPMSAKNIIIVCVCVPFVHSRMDFLHIQSISGEGGKITGYNTPRVKKKKRVSTANASDLNKISHSKHLSKLYTANCFRSVTLQVITENLQVLVILSYQIYVTSSSNCYLYVTLKVILITSIFYSQPSLYCNFKI